ncbi:nucleobase:cation symporter-2 family protein [Polyangium sp. 15x6]|uniref:nucleobase:cation symporter-2 family protein n=1 Tax=Polyangium sp. 15x6 TaxID=3042687 RepID=UPI00249AABFB|nr:nucleobase:cation symporter-2 family protein [Polyangium sp. 15x6]MDI3290162.1 nucleobase:cation symporter-2 family protein [Polyangium sp. 15x6]
MASQSAPDPVDAWLPLPRLLAYGLQHVLAMYAGAVAVPLIVAGALGLSREELVYLIGADLFTCGLATLVQTVGFPGFGVRLPVIQGCTFAAVGPMILIGKTGGLPSVYGAVIAAGALTLLVAPFFARLLRFFPPVVTGSIITLIGISLLPVAVRWAGGGDPSSPNFGAPAALALAFTTFALVLLYKRVLRGFWQGVAVLLGLVSGTLIAAALGKFDLAGVREAQWIAVTTPFAFGLPHFDPGAVASMALVMLVVMVESTGDFVALGELTGRPLTPEALARGLRADGLSTMLGGVLNAFPYTAYAQNVGLVALSRVRSRWVVAAAGLILVVLGLLPKLSALVAAIPAPVLGGAGLLMFGQVAASGLRTLSRVDFDSEQGRMNGLIVAATLAVGLIPLGAPNFWRSLPPWLQVILQSGITAGSVTGILLHAVFARGGESSKDAAHADSRGP